MGTLNNSQFRNIFYTALKDQKSNVRAAALVALADSNEKDIVALCRKIFETDESYLVMAEALKIIGEHGDKTQLAFLNEARKMKSARDVVGSAAGQAIDMINNK